ncbi:MAG: hypothetical protein LBQ02_00835 [Candidatus Nomurabacteria bacterium]|jgi:16S rRNA G966 N2-methylase RsmD/cytidylate kinase|nr:hypothetical protein [Candidatus Nomurabacteria bacterium]
MENAKNKIYLVSAEMPGCGSTSLCNEISRKTGASVVRIGEYIRKNLNVNSEKELNQALSKITGGHDEQFYRELSQDTDYVVDGKMATAIGPHYLDCAASDITSIDLTSHPLISAKRVMQRETGLSFGEIIAEDDHKHALAKMYKMVLERAAHSQDMRQSIQNSPSGHVHTHLIDTGNMPIPEAYAVLSNEDYQSSVKDWEMEALNENINNLIVCRQALDRHLHEASAYHFKHNLERVKYRTDQLDTMLGKKAIELVRFNLKHALIDSWANLTMKSTPRFFVHDNDAMIDTESPEFSPEYYKLAAIWPIVESALKDKIVLDPFAGSGILTNALAAKNITKKIYISDIDCGNADSPKRASAPELNRKAWELAFDGLPSFYRPDLSSIENISGVVAHNIPLPDKSIDYVVTDPPYGATSENDNLDLVVSNLDEMLRVSKEGVIMLIPEQYESKIQQNDRDVIKLTKDVSGGRSEIPTVYVHIKSKERGKS